VKNLEQERKTEKKETVQKSTENVVKSSNVEAKKAGVNTAEKSNVKAKAKNAEKKNFVAFFEKNTWLIAGIACIAIIALLVVSIGTPETANVNDFQNTGSNAESVIKMIIVSSNRCAGCEEANSFEVLFSAEGIRYNVQTIEESTIDGQSLIQALGIKKLPAYVIEEESIGSDATVTTSAGEFIPLKKLLQIYVGQGKGTYNEGIFQFPEMDLDEITRPKILLEEPCGNAENINIQLFADPYDPNSIRRSMDVQNFVEILKGLDDVNVSFGYNYLPTYSRLLETYWISQFGGSQEVVRENIEGAARYLVCANREFELKNFNKLQQEMYALYCDLNAAEMPHYGAEQLSKCIDSNHFNSFITADELKELERKAMLYDGIKLSQCLFTVENTRFPASIELAKKVGIIRTPTVLINCQYEVRIEHMGKAVCRINNNLPVCN